MLTGQGKRLGTWLLGGSLTSGLDQFEANKNAVIKRF